MDLRLLVAATFAVGAAAGFGAHAFLFPGSAKAPDPEIPERPITLAEGSRTTASSGAAAGGPGATSILATEDEMRLRYEGIRDWARRGEFVQRLVSESVENGTWRRSLAFLLSLPAGPLRSEGLFSLVSELSRRDPRRAFEEVLPQLQGIDHYNAVTEIALNWSLEDPVGAFDFAASGEGEPMRAAIAELAAYELAASDPSETFRRIDSLRDSLSPEEFEGARTGLLAGWAKLDASAAIDYVLNHSDAEPEQREIFLESIIASHASVDPGAALALAETAFADPETRSAARELIFEVWSQQDPASAAQAVSQLPAGEETDALVVELVREWRNYDEGAANRWLESFQGISADAREELRLQPARPGGETGATLR